MHAGEPLQCAADLIWSQIFRKFPDLKIALSEGGIGWIPYFLDRIDFIYQHHKAWTRQDFGDKLPSQVFREHIITCFIDDPTGVKLLDDIGVDMITWECDYPHSDSTWPNAPEVFMKTSGTSSDDEINKMTHENTMRVFQYDPFAHRAEGAVHRRCAAGRGRRRRRRHPQPAEEAVEHRHHLVRRHCVEGAAEGLNSSANSVVFTFA